MGNVTGGGQKGGSDNSSWNSPELRLACSLFVAFMVFLICWSPYAVVVLIDIHDKWPKVQLTSLGGVGDGGGDGGDDCGGGDIDGVGGGDGCGDSDCGDSDCGGGCGDMVVLVMVVVVMVVVVMVVVVMVMVFVYETPSHLEFNQLLHMSNGVGVLILVRVYCDSVQSTLCWWLR